MHSRLDSVGGGQWEARLFGLALRLQVHLFIICHSYTAKLPPKSISAKDSRSPGNLLAVPAGEQAVVSILRLECHQTITTDVAVINTEIRTDSFKRWIQTQTTEQSKAGDLR